MKEEQVKAEDTMGDDFNINKVIMSGRAGNTPRLQTLSNGTQLCYFSLSVTEKWETQDGQPMERNNWFKIEVLGKNADAAFNKVKKNNWYLIDGYLRHEKFEENKSIVKIRAYSVKLLKAVDN